MSQFLWRCALVECFYGSISLCYILFFYMGTQTHAHSLTRPCPNHLSYQLGTMETSFTSIRMPIFPWTSFHFIVRFYNLQQCFQIRSRTLNASTFSCLFLNFKNSTLSYYLYWKLLVILEVTFDLFVLDKELVGHCTCSSWGQVLKYASTVACLWTCMWIFHIHLWHWTSIHYGQKLEGIFLVIIMLHNQHK